MIDYDPHNWRSHLFDVRGSMVREIFGRVTLCVAWSAAVAAFDVYVREVHIPSIVHMVLGGAISLLLVFRTNSAYDRFWEGRRMWGNIINESRNLGRSAAVYLRAAPDLQQEVVEGTIAFAHATRCRLRNEANPGVDGAHEPLHVSLRISGALQAARDRGVISDYLLATIDNNVQLLIDYLGACERIHKTPIPFAYMVHLRRGLILYCYSLPFALVQEYTWIAIPLTFFVAYVFFGIEEIGVEIEDPFGTDDNDLPLDRFCEVIESDLRELIPK
jgi:putative membrane protein